MSRTTRALTPARRDAGLRRLRTLNRLLAAAAVIGTALLTDVAANAFPGHRRSASSAAAGEAQARGTIRRHHHARHHRHAGHHALLAAPAASTPAPAPTAPAPQASVSPAAPVVSGGS